MITLVLPAFNERENLPELYARLNSITNSLSDYKFQFIFIDDGSTDGTLGFLLDLRERDPRVEILSFIRNFGSHSAVYSGLEFCSGDAAIILATDLQDPVELIPRFLKEWSDGVKVVWAVRNNRPTEPWLTRLCALLYYRIINRLTGLRLPPKGADFLLIDREVINATIRSADKNAPCHMMISWLGFPEKQIFYEKKDRISGKSKWSMTSRIKLVADSIFSFSYVPLRLMSSLGVLFSFFGFVYGMLIFLRALLGYRVEGWASLMVVILLFGGLQMIMFGVLGEYMWRIFDQVRPRPRALIRINTTCSDSRKKS